MVLRHQPHAIGLALDGQGWAEIDALIARARRGLTRALIDEIVQSSDKKRFEISPDGSRIRAVHGHSVDVDVLGPAVPPPDMLYHGTSPAVVGFILRDGLKPMRRRHVHLSETVEQARAVGRRHCRAGAAPVILTIAAAALAARGATFHRSTSGVWLTQAAPPEALGVLETP